MYYLEQLTVGKSIIHILDNSLTVPILSMQISDNPDTTELFANHLIKTLNDDSLKKCQFNEDYNLFLTYLKEYQKDKEKFVDFSIQIAELLFSIMSAHPEIPAGDLCVMDFYYSGNAYVGILKMNYQVTYIHYTDNEQEQNVNHIIQHRTTLPGITQRVNEAIIIDLDTLEVLVLEKPVEIEGTKENYLSKRFLKCGTKLSSKEQMGIVKKVTDQLSKKYFDEDIEKKMDIKTELYNNIESSGEVNLEKFATQVFQAQEEVKEAFFEALEKQGLEEPVIQLSEKTISRSFDKQRIKTDNGIEIKIPMELYNDPSKMEFITEPDGKISIVIKNINKILG